MPLFIEGYRGSRLAIGKASANGELWVTGQDNEKYFKVAFEQSKQKGPLRVWRRTSRFWIAHFSVALIEGVMSTEQESCMALSLVPGRH